MNQATLGYFLPQYRSIREQSYITHQESMEVEMQETDIYISMRSLPARLGSLLR